MREHVVEADLCSWAEANGWIVRKMAYRGRKGCRDCDFYGFGHTVKMEMKRPGRGEGGLDPLQVRERNRLAQAGVRIWVIDDVEAGIAVLKRYAAAPRTGELT